MKNVTEQWFFKRYDVNLTIPDWIETAIVLLSSSSTIITSL